MILADLQIAINALNDAVGRYMQGDEMVTKGILNRRKVDVITALDKYKDDATLCECDWQAMDIMRMKGLESRIKELKEQVGSFRKQYQELKEGGKK